MPVDNTDLACYVGVAMQVWPTNAWICAECKVYFKENSGRLILPNCHQPRTIIGRPSPSISAITLCPRTVRLFFALCTYAHTSCLFQPFLLLPIILVNKDEY